MRSDQSLRSVMKRYVTLRTTLQRLEEEEAENEEEEELCAVALKNCPVEAIGDNGDVE